MSRKETMIVKKRVNDYQESFGHIFVQFDAKKGNPHLAGFLMGI